MISQPNNPNIYSQEKCTEDASPLDVLSNRFRPIAHHPAPARLAGMRHGPCQCSSSNYRTDLICVRPLMEQRTKRRRCLKYFKSFQQSSQHKAESKTIGTGQWVVSIVFKSARYKMIQVRFRSAILSTFLGSPPEHDFNRRLDVEVDPIDRVLVGTCLRYHTGKNTGSAWLWQLVWNDCKIHSVSPLPDSLAPFHLWDLLHLSPSHKVLHHRSEEGLEEWQAVAGCGCSAELKLMHRDAWWCIVMLQRSSKYPMSHSISRW